MSQIVFLTPPAHGHLNPILPVIQELVRRGEQMTCDNNKAIRMQIEQTDAEVRDYPETKLSAEAISMLLEEGNLEQIWF